MILFWGFGAASAMSPKSDGSSVFGWLPAMKRIGIHWHIQAIMRITSYQLRTKREYPSQRIRGRMQCSLHVPTVLPPIFELHQYRIDHRRPFEQILGLHHIDQCYRTLLQIWIKKIIIRWYITFNCNKYYVWFRVPSHLAQVWCYSGLGPWRR